MNNTILNSYSGIKANQFGLDSVANNIANLNTTGYKEHIPEFRTLLGRHVDSTSPASVSSDMNYGTAVASNAISTKTGNLKQSDGEFDVAYTGKGWFVVGKSEGGKGKVEIGKDSFESDQEVYFTRDGSFSRDSDGYLVTSGGMYVYGVDLGKIKGNTLSDDKTQEEDAKALVSGELKPIQIPQDLLYQPTATSKIEVALNLNATQGYAPLGDYLLSADGKLDAQKLDSLDLDALFAPDNQPIDARMNNDIKITLKTGSGANAKTEDMVFKYGSGGADASEFRTFGDLKALFAARTGLELDVAHDGEGALIQPLRFQIKDVKGAEPIHLTMGGKFADRLDWNLANVEFKGGDTQLSGKLGIASETSRSEIFDAEGKKYELKTRYFLTQAANRDLGLKQHWETRSAVYDALGKEKISKEDVISDLEFDANGQAVASHINVDLRDQKIDYYYGGTEKQKTTNLNYKESGILKTDSDGRREGRLSDVKIDENGIIVLNFDNEKSVPVGRLGIAAFTNDQGLQSIGGNLFEMARAPGANGEMKMLSGNPILGWDDKDEGRLKFGKVSQHYLETSNTDVTKALTNLILMQRAYAMNAKAFSTGDDLIKEAINLKKS